MKLMDLSPQFLKRIPEDGREVWHDVEDIAEADGVEFLCPVCFDANKGPIGTHAITCWQPQVPAGIEPGPGRWTFHGTGYADLTLTAGSSSIYLTGPGCGAHFFIENGGIRFSR